MPSTNYKSLKISLLVAGLMLCFAVVPVWPYGFYTLLRLGVCGVSVYAAYQLKENDALKKHLVPLAVLAVLFNPFMPVHLTRLLWLVIDLGTAVYFLNLAKKLPA
jgi:hypothetical protein